jgi:copper chaperone CopZ
MSMTKEDFRVEGLCCYSCATTVEKEVARIKGVKSALSDYKKKIMSIEYDEKVVDRVTLEAKMAEVMKRFETGC